LDLNNDSPSFRTFEAVRVVDLVASQLRGW
jgi:hypothetical protein